MKKLKKYNGNNDSDKLLSKMASYAAIAGAFVAFDSDSVMAQCATAGAPLPVDIDGDGTTDANIVLNNFPGPYLLTSGMNTTALASFTTMVNYSDVRTITAAAIPTTTTFGCLVTTGPAQAAINPASTAMGTLMWSTTLSFYDLNLFSNFAYFYSVNQAYIAVSGANVLASAASGAAVCSAVTAAPAATAIAGTAFNISSSYVQYVTGDINSMYFPNPASNGSFTLQHPDCTDSFGSIYLGLMQTLAPQTGTFATTNVLASGPNYYGPNFVSTQVNPATQFVGVEFAGGDGTQYGWVELSFDGTQACVVSTGFNGCSAEEVAAAGAAAGTECIAVGDASTNPANEACSVAPPACNADNGTISITPAP